VPAPANVTDGKNQLCGDCTASLSRDILKQNDGPNPSPENTRLPAFAKMRLKATKLKTEKKGNNTREQKINKFA
jgi:hypothetical protein